MSRGHKKEKMILIGFRGFGSHRKMISDIAKKLGNDTSASEAVRTAVEKLHGQICTR